MLRINKKLLLYLLLIFPFFEPGIVTVLSSLAMVSTMYDVWRLFTIIIAIVLWISKFRKLDGFLITIFLFYGWVCFVTIFNQVGLFSFFSQCGSIIALCLLVDMCYRSGEMKVLLKAIIGLLTVYLAINAVTILIFEPQGGIVTDIESITMKKNNYFLGYDNQHVYYFLPYLAMSLFYDRTYQGKIKLKTIIMHIIVVWSVIACWSVDTVVAVAFFYTVLLVSKMGIVSKFINSYTIIITNAICFYMLVNVVMSKKLSVLLQIVLNKSLSFAREAIWTRYLVWVYRSPILGNGYVNTARRYSMAKASHAHNMYLDVFFVAGIVGLILFAVIIFLATNSGRKIVPREQMFIIIGIFAYMVAFQATARTYCPSFFLMLAISYELSIGSENSIKTVKIQGLQGL